MEKIEPIVKSFDELSLQELYAILRLRNKVFVVEQQSIYQDADNVDQHCHHLMLYSGTKLAAYSRLVPAGVKFQETSIGRVASDQEFRGVGAGKLLLKYSIDNCERLFGIGNIRISAQLYLKNFYNSFGFLETGAPYDEDGIPHIQMLRS